jgi:ferritin-like metal-binding protein YciE
MPTRSNTTKTSAKNEKSAPQKGLLARSLMSFQDDEPEMEYTSNKSLDNLFMDMLKDIYYAEKKIAKALPKMVKAAQCKDLRAAFEDHHEETLDQIMRLEEIFDLMGKKAAGKKCPAIEGILEEGEEIMEEFKGSRALDAGLIAAAQAVEHYEISRYGTLRAWAIELGHKDVVKLIEKTLKEESRCDENLSKMAHGSYNEQANAA